MKRVHGARILFQRWLLAVAMLGPTGCVTPSPCDKNVSERSMNWSKEGVHEPFEEYSVSEPITLRRDGDHFVLDLEAMYFGRLENVGFFTHVLYRLDLEANSLFFAQIGADDMECDEETSSWIAPLIFTLAEEDWLVSDGHFGVGATAGNYRTQGLLDPEVLAGTFDGPTFQVQLPETGNNEMEK